MIAGRMLERLAMLDLSDDQRRVAAQQDRLLISVRHHLSCLLNTRAGSVPIDPDYGVPDLSVGPGAGELHNADAMAQALLAVIYRYEPRLLNPQLRIALSGGDNLSTRLTLTGDVLDSVGKRPVSLTGTIAGDGVIELDSIE